MHGHSSAPFLPTPANLYYSYSHGLNLTIYSSGQCGVVELRVTIDWWNSFGRWGTRYWNAVFAWGTGVVTFVFFTSIRTWDLCGRTLTPGQALLSASTLLPKAALLFFVISLLPLPNKMWLGNTGEFIFSPIAPLILLISTGMVCLTWIVLRLCLYLLGKPLALVMR